MFKAIQLHDYMLRSVPNELGGVIALLLEIFILYILQYLT